MVGIAPLPIIVVTTGTFSVVKSVLCKKLIVCTLLDNVSVLHDKTKGFDAAVADMEVGEIKEIHLMPEEAYGMPDPNAIIEVEIAQLPGSEELTVGQQVYLTNQYGQPFLVKVTGKDEKMITFDANHEMAGKELNFKIELVEVK